MNPIVKPGFGAETAGMQCYLCKSDKRPNAPGVLSTGVEVETEGMLDICLDCVRHAAHIIGMPAAETMAVLLAERDQAVQSLAAAERRIEGLEAKAAELDIRRRELDRSMAGLRTIARMTPEQAEQASARPTAAKPKVKAAS